MPPKKAATKATAKTKAVKAPATKAGKKTTAAKPAAVPAAAAKGGNGNGPKILITHRGG